ncbi:MAG: PfkB family carbohydrate kinase [Phycisphaeraceae bacterium]
MDTGPGSVVTVTLHTAMDRVLETTDFAVGAHLAANEVLHYPAGKGINVSRALARLGAGSIATGFVGQAEAGQFDRALAEAGSGRALAQLLHARGRTRENITILDTKNHTNTHVRTGGYELTRHDVQRIMSKVGLLARPGVLLVIAGSLPPGFEVADFDTLIYMALGGGARVVLDVPGELLAKASSVALTLPAAADAPATRGTPGNGGGGGGKLVWMIKPNRQELADALGLAGPMDEATLRDVGLRLAQRVAWVVVTLGADGAAMFTDGQAWRGRCRVDVDAVVNTVGCGDCLLAGLLDAQARQLEPEAVLARGLCAAAANATCPGVATFDVDQIHRFEQQAIIEPW